MKCYLVHPLLIVAIALASCSTQTTPDEALSQTVNLDQYPSVDISNGTVQMKVYLPDADKGLYRATRFDWSGIIGSVQYKDHEYFGYWKDTHDPMIHEDLAGPVEGFS